jgi:hypothetical protein
MLRLAPFSDHRFVHHDMTFLLFWTGIFPASFCQLSSLTLRPRKQVSLCMGCKVR